MVQGIHLVTLLWRAGTDAIPCDDRLDANPVDGMTKHTPLRAMVVTTLQRDRKPRYVAFASISLWCEMTEKSGRA